MKAKTIKLALRRKVDDLAALLAEKGLDKRPDGK